MNHSNLYNIKSGTKIYVKLVSHPTEKDIKMLQVIYAKIILENNIHSFEFGIVTVD